jgi:thiol:disulfide interchange protein DsbD
MLRVVAGLLRLNTLFPRTWIKRMVMSTLLKLRFLVLLCLCCLLPRLTLAEDYLDPEKAFLFSAKMRDAKTVQVTYTIADGYYMYRDKFRFRATGATLGEAKIPHGKVKFDETFNKEVETYHGKLVIEIPVEANAEFTLVSTGQGCAEAGLCYPPQESELKLTPPKATKADAPQPETKNLPKADVAKNDAPAVPSSVPKVSVASAVASSSVASGGAVAGNAASGPAVASVSGAAIAVTAPVGSSSTTAAALASVAIPAAPASTEESEISRSLKGGKLLEILPWFFLLGLGLSFTPCVLPMVPILSFIIVGEGAAVKRSRAFMLSVAYVLGMALVYTILGVVAGLLGEGLAASLQNPWVLGVFGAMMVALALSMFGFYQLQVPSALQAKLSEASEHQRRGKFFGVFVMGAISALIVGPCVAAPLAGTLVFISQTHDVVIGGSALFALAIGMGVPLLLVGASAGSLLPKAGHWMEAVERFFGVLMLATALWLVSPVLPGALQLAGWAAIGLGYGAYLIWARDGHWASKAFGMTFAILGALELVGVISGGRDPFVPLGHLRAEAKKVVSFQRIKSVAELDAVIAQNPGRPVMLDFYADWCVSCKEMEKLTFSEPAVQAKLGKALLVQADVTVNSPEDKALLKRFNLFGPPGIIFFDGQGREMLGQRVIGYQNSEKFLASLAATRLF